jgi:hypothetical protein
MIKVSKEVIKNRKSKDWKYNGQPKKTKRIATDLKKPPDTYNFKDNSNEWLFKKLGLEIKHWRTKT